VSHSDKQQRDNERQDSMHDDDLLHQSRSSSEKVTPNLRALVLPAQVMKMTDVSPRRNELMV
jgi:hypothetical protein